MSKKSRRPVVADVNAQITTRLGDTIIDVRELQAARPQPRAWPLIAAGVALAGAGLGLFGYDASQDWRRHWEETQAAEIAEMPAPAAPGLGFGGLSLLLALAGVVPLGLGLWRRAERPATRFSIGEGRGATLAVPGEGLPEPSAFDLVVAGADGMSMRFGTGMTGILDVDGAAASLAELAATGALHESAGIHRVRLDAGTRATIVHHDLSFTVEAVAPTVHGCDRPAIDRPFWIATAAAALVLGGSLAACALADVTEPDGAAYVVDEVPLGESESPTIRAFLSMNLDPEIEEDDLEIPELAPPSDELDLEAIAEAADRIRAHRHRGEEGKMGKPTSKMKSGLYAMRGPRDAAPQMARSYDPEMAGRQSGILGVMRQQSGHFLASPHGGAYSVGKESSDVWGGLSAGRVGPVQIGHPGDRYGQITENVWSRVSEAPLSTFAVDVDTAAYANVRRHLGEGFWPTASAIRVEEMINYFDYQDRAPTGDVPLAVAAEVALAPWNPQHRLVRIGVKAREVAKGKVPPRNLVFLLDTSGSMQGADRLQRVVKGLVGLVNELRPEDRVSIVTYAGDSGIVLPPTPGSQRRAILEALTDLRPAGGTNGAAGIGLAYRLAHRHAIKGGINRVILATDGDFNVGVSSRDALVTMIERERSRGVFLSVLGVGRGNLNDHMMEQIADHGNGNYAYLDSDREAERVLVDQASSTLVTVAKDVKIQVELNPAKVASYRLIGYENRALAAEDFADDAKDGGEVGAGHTVTALYEVIPTGSRDALDGQELRYQNPRTLAAAAASDELLSVKIRYKEPDGERSRLIVERLRDRDVDAGQASDAFRLAAASAAFGMILRGSEHVGEWTLADVAALLERVALDDPKGEIAELRALVKRAVELQGRVAMR
ncbi:MAG: VWA domain-containing protein [Myxococcales bacterium]|nr:VWA domain-containing protein [Myxococcales bacterium]